MPPDLQRVAQALVECLDQVPQIVEYLQRLAQRCRDNAGYLADISNHPAARNAALELDMAARCCDDAAHLLSLTPLQARAWAMQMVGGERTSTRSATTGTGPRDVPGIRPGTAVGKSERPPAGVSRPVVLDRTPFPRHPDIEARLPDRPEARGPTSGILTTPDGRELAQVKSGRQGPGQGAFGLTGNTALLDVALTHAEGHAAALMRQPGGPREATLYVNNRPCPGFLGCDRTLPWQLPKGAKLTVHWPGGTTVYIGDGTGLG